MSKQAVIIGAGIAGLATALRLRQAGWTPLVVERAPARRTGGYTVTFSDLGYDAAQRLGILDELAERHITPDALHYLKPSGVRRFSVPGPTVRAMLGRRALNLMRGDIEDVLYRAVAADVEIRFGTTATAVRAEPAAVTVELDDGSTVRADLLVGADGLHSATRAATFGPERDFRLDLDHMVGVFTLDRLPSGVTPGATETLTEAGRTLAVIATGDRRPTAFFGYRCADPAAELAAGPTAALPAAYERMGWVAPQVLEQLAGADEVYFDSISQIVLPSWHRGRVAILGDAAWCVTLFAGFGASLAVAGADALGTALERHGDDVDAALAEWEAGLRPYAERKQQLGRQVRGLYAPADRTRLFLRDLPLRLAALPPVGRQLQRRLQLTR
jgi:2-polyprenyl-6-methoxyphenol hydroxylase-like FAD-dependent oxidoreductase